MFACDILITKPKQQKNQHITLMLNNKSRSKKYGQKKNCFQKASKHHRSKTKKSANNEKKTKKKLKNANDRSSKTVTEDNDLGNAKSNSSGMSLNTNKNNNSNSLKKKEERKKGSKIKNKKMEHRLSVQQSDISNKRELSEEPESRDHSDIIGNDKRGSIAVLSVTKSFGSEMAAIDSPRVSQQIQPHSIENEKRISHRLSEIPINPPNLISVASDDRNTSRASIDSIGLRNHMFDKKSKKKQKHQRQSSLGITTHQKLSNLFDNKTHFGLFILHLQKEFSMENLLVI